MGKPARPRGRGADAPAPTPAAVEASPETAPAALPPPGAALAPGDSAPLAPKLPVVAGASDSSDAADFAGQPTGPFETARVSEATIARQAAMRRPPPVPAAALEPILDAGDGPGEVLEVVPPSSEADRGWHAERRSVREPKVDPLTITSVGAAINVYDVDTRPLDRRATGLSSPWQAGTVPQAKVEAVSAEGEVALSALPELRRGTQPVEVAAVRRGSTWHLFGAVAVLALAAASVFLVRRAQLTSVRPVVAIVPPVPVAEIEPADSAAHEIEAAREVLRAAVLAAYQREDFTEVMKLGLELEASFGLDWEAEFVLAEATRLARYCPEAVQRYAGFIERFPNNTRTDDAHFWLAECLRQQGDKKGARWHYKAVLAASHSNLAKQARKRLRELD
jgi:hypothetical protein